ncbi:MAG: hypothetical protein ACLRMN_03815 [Mediterraneibacter gnavus]
MAVWTYLWDIPFDKNTLLGKKDFGTTVWAKFAIVFWDATMWMIDL